MLLRDNRVIESFRTLLRAGETSPEVLRRRSLLIAVLMMIAVYPDVIFMKASLSLTNYYFSLEESRQRRVILIKERKNRGPHHGMSDAGGSVFQSEPGAQFMKNTLWSWDSPFWNPYSAAGNYGPETLVDIKTSPLSMLTALLGGSDAAFHVAYLGMTLLGLWCLLCLLSVRFRLGLAATLAGGIMFLLDGYLTANLASNVSQTWLIFPALLLALAEYAHRPRVVPLIGVAFASASILCATFLPTTLLVMTTASVLGASVALGRFLEAGGRSVPGNFAALVRAWTGQAAGVLGGLALVAVLYLPVWEALDYMKTGEFYAARTFITASLFNLISAFSPKHVIEIYNAVPVEALHLIRNFVFHQGIVSALLVSQAVRRWPRGVAPFLIAAAALIVLFGGRAYGVPGIFEAVGLLPVIGHVGEQYLWISISLAVVLIVPFGVEALTAPDSPRRLPLLGMSLTILLALAYSASVWGLKGRAGYYVPILVGILIIGTTLIALGRILQRRPRLYRGVITVALFCELTFYVNHMRFERTDRFGQPPQTVRFLQLNAGLQRVVGFGPFSLPPEFPSAFGLYGIGSMTFNIQPDYFSFWNRLIQPDPKDRWATFSNFSQQPDKENINLAPLDFLGVRYALVNLAFEKQIAFMKGAGWREVLRNTNHSRGGEPGMVLENPHVLPRAWIVPALAERKLTPLDDGASAREIAYTEDPALLQIARSIGVGDTAGAVDDTPVAITRYRHTRVDLQVQMARPGVLVLTDTWHPNWSVRVDGAPAHLGRVDEAFRGVALGPGPHRIEMRYRPKTLSLGQAISSLMLLLLVALFLTRRRVDRLLARPAPV